MSAYLLVAAASALVCAVLTPLMRRIGTAAGVFTPARERDVHEGPIPKLGGVAMALGVLAGLGVAALVPGTADTLVALPGLRGLLAALGIVLLVGVADDLWDLPWGAKLVGQCAAALVVALGGLRIEAMPVGWLPVGGAVVQTGLTVFAIVLTMNAINFVDGLDGLAAGVALIGASAFLVYAWQLARTVPWTDHADLAAVLMAVLVGACAGFLPYNRFPARIFMGEVGALLIGLLMATAALAVTADVGAVHAHRFRNVPAFMPIILPLAVLALPLTDLVFAVLRRTARGTSPFSADRGHLHHRLVDGGYTHAQAVWLLWLWAFLIAWGVVALTFLDASVVLPLLLAALAAAAVVTLRPIVRRRRDEATR